MKIDPLVIKEHEESESSRRFLRGLPVLARIDGKKFSKYTATLNKPFDTGFSECMIKTTEELVNETNTLLAYTQSDEISLVFLGDDISQIFCDGRISKMTSILSSMATAFFNTHLRTLIPSKVDSKPAFFDTRVWSVPSKQDVIDYLISRQTDCQRNSVSMAARSIYSHKALHGKNTKEMQEMMFTKNVNWNDYNTHFRQGTFLKKVAIPYLPGSDEHNKIPEKYRTDEPIIRSAIVREHQNLNKSNNMWFIFGEDGEDARGQV
jgi:tRNA(His) 5'-end guanylyltransferase